MFQSYQLTNKANVILIPQQDTKSITTLVMYPVGSRYEPEKLSGVSHYVEHLMFKGTKKRKNTLTLTREIDRLGAEYNAFTGKEYTGYYIKADATYLPISLDILSDMLFHSVFDPKEMEKEKGPIVEELRMYKDNPLMDIDNVFEDVLYKGSPLGRDIGGTEKHVMSYKRDDVLAYRDKYYDVSNMTIVVAGAVTDKTKGAIETYFGQQASQTKASKTFLPYCFGPKQKTDRIIVQQKKTDQAQLMIGFPAFSHGGKENTTLDVLNTILGGSMSSRLFIQIRERRGLAYMIRSGSQQFRDTGYMYIRAGLDPKNVNKALGVMQDEIHKIIDKGVTKRELMDAKTHIKGSLTLSLEDSSAQANWYAEQALFMNRISTPEEEMEKIEAVTNEHIKALAKKIFKFNDMRLAIIGDVSPESIRI
ncbi:MAG: insulinase family protein [Candidatus Magasanikbacteria bacterium]|nr:insulinase family protein [Candidatus Magasanikbacteria bacterium]